MEPAIQYTNAVDGVSIAWWEAGDGYPLVDVHNPPFSNIRFDWQLPFHQRLAERFRLIRFDTRGSGLSQRDAADVSVDAMVADMEAVAAAAKIERFAIFSDTGAAPVTIAYGIKYPNRVSHLVLWNPILDQREFLDTPRMKALRSVMEQDWELYTEGLASTMFGWKSGDGPRGYALLLRDSVEPDTARKVFESLGRCDITPLLGSVSAPTLVLHPSSSELPPLRASQLIAASIPGARLRTGTAGEPWSDEIETSTVDAVWEFVGTGRPPANQTASSSATTGTAEGLEAGRTDATMRMAAAREKSFSSGRYVVRRVLGEGGQKIVYLVHDTALDRECALSVIKRDLLEPDDLLRLQREAQSMARLGAHATVVTIFDIGEDDGTPYIVCEYVPGGDLSHELRTVGTLPLDRAMAIATDVAEALVIAHAHGVVHRDIKPSNVWICENGSAKLGDFGLAFSLDRSRLTMPGTFLGTASYMPPEQALGRPAEPRSDLYSLGAILYEMVTGAPPFVADDALSVISQHVNVTPVPPITHNPDLPPALDALILHLLAKSPDDRPASASEVAGELRSVRQTATHIS